MEALKLLVVEDHDEEIEVCKSSQRRYIEENSRQIEITFCKTKEEAVKMVDKSFDGAIVDLKLGNEGNEGDEFIQLIQTLWRIPVAVFTGTPLNFDQNPSNINVYKKGEVRYDEIFDYFFDIYKTGLTKIFGNRGTIETVMLEIFWKNIFPSISIWKSHVSKGKETEKALLRFTINHLLEILDDSGICFPEEMYILPLNSDHLKTGTIVSKKETREKYIVLSPSCDLAKHNGTFKTDRILVCGIENNNSDILDSTKKRKAAEASNPSISLESSKLNKEQNKEYMKIIQNNHKEYYHFLPKSGSFPGGIINFRKIETFTIEQFTTLFDPPAIQVFMAFTKDIVARFSAYYARQGQPDFDFQSLLDDLEK